ncbi:hydrogenase maturation nickel metallochaperone HypA/HybF [Alteribacter natronophilus]|uniref:hydrogenase maturation nickel metallochaperone HypA/HybF n=1 Tax=Alteribacter natronophilus TaxID=2583810 RepID=UPI00110EBEAD|nr:hydrogenase maturation nickel metallochaperone HypA [Alteribacter natronophilus]TMW71433.1 hydrogenase maturation nickel metallochaperone HypA [Alteribacter natronophilus]
MFTEVDVMHEWGLMQEIIRIVSEEAYQNGMEEVTRIEVIVGEWSNVLPDALEIAFGCIRGELSGGPISKQTDLIVKSEPALARCRVCGCTFKPDYRLAFCPGCERPEADLISGETFRVDAFEGREINEN